MHRDATAKRPFWRIDDSVASTIRRAASGWEDGDRPVSLIYGGTDAIDTKRAISKARDWFMRYSSFPFYFYDGGWFRPIVEEDTSPTAADPLPAGDYSVVVTAVSFYQEETCASDVFNFSLDEPKSIIVRCPLWPYQAPLAAAFRAYLSTPSNSAYVLSNQAYIPEYAAGWAPVPLILPTTATQTPPARSKVSAGVVNVDYTQTQMYDSQTAEGEYDGVLSLHLSRPLWTHINLEGTEGYRPYAAEDLSVSITI